MLKGFDCGSRVRAVLIEFGQDSSMKEGGFAMSEVVSLPIKGVGEVIEQMPVEAPK